MGLYLELFAVKNCDGKVGWGEVGSGVGNLSVYKESSRWGETRGWTDVWEGREKVSSGTGQKGFLKNSEVEAMG